MGDFPESLSRAMLVGVMLVGRLGVALDKWLSLTAGSLGFQGARALRQGPRPRRAGGAAPVRGTRAVHKVV